MALDAQELAQIQADLAAVVCDKDCVVQRKTSTPDGMGTQTEAWNVIETTKAGMSQPSAGELTNYAFRIEALAAWHVNLPWGTNVQAEDHLIIDGQTLNVHVLLDPHSIPGLLPVLAAEVKP